MIEDNASPLDNEITNEVSVFNMSIFQGVASWLSRSHVKVSKSDFIDTYDNEYLSAYLGYHDISSEKGTTYLLDGNYSKCEGEFVWPKNRKNSDGSIWIEFYSEDNLVYQTDPITATDKAMAFEFSVTGVEKLTIVRKGTARAVYAIYPYLNLIK